MFPAMMTAPRNNDPSLTCQASPDQKEIPVPLTHPILLTDLHAYDAYDDFVTDVTGISPPF